MTTITITKASDNTYKGIECSGHAAFAEYGNDIVCSAISALTINLINSIDRFTDDEIDVEQNETDGIMSFRFKSKPGHDSELLVKSYELGADSIFRQYGKKFLNIKYRRE